VIAIMAGMMAFALFAAQETARVHKTKAFIAKLDAIIKAKHETYRTRRVPVNIGADTFTDSNGNGSWDFGEPFIADWNGNGTFDLAQTPPVAAKIRLDCLRDLMRLEMPDRWTDVEDDPTAPFELATKIVRPSVSAGYKRRFDASTPSNEFQNAECLYMIVMHAQQEDADDRSAIRSDQIGDVDGDGFPEFLDAWGQPIRFLRWCPGFVSELNKPADHDPFDPRNVYPDLVGHPEPNFAIYPLVYSSGPDKCYGIVSNTQAGLHYKDQNLNPCFVPRGAEKMMGTPDDLPNEPNFVPRGWVDNIHSHLITAR